MSNVTVVKVKVDELSKYGYKANGKFVNYSKQLSDSDKARVVPGAEFEAEYFVADSGKEYLNKIVSPIQTRAEQDRVIAAIDVNKLPNLPNGVVKPDTERAKRFTPKFTKKETPDNTMSKQEWAEKDQRISRQGAVQASAIALAPVVSLEQLPEEMVKLATAMLAFVNGAK